MLWYKSWLETRWRFLIGAALLMFSAASMVLFYPELMKLMPLAGSIDAEGEIGRQIKESVALSQSYRGYVWSQWFSRNGLQLGTLFAVLLGSGNPLSQGSGAVLFTLSLPASRNLLLQVRAATALVELLALALVPAVIIPVLSPAVGETYSVASALTHAICFFIAASAFFSLALLLSTVFDDVWRPLLVACSVAAVVAVFEQLLGNDLPYGVFRVMSAEAYFRTGELPWTGLAASAGATLAMLYAATVNIARRDF
jgi:ABC-2 type transport system permease protein